MTVHHAALSTGLGALSGGASGLLGVGLFTCLAALAGPLGPWPLAVLAPVGAGIAVALLAHHAPGVGGTGVPAVVAAARADRPLPLRTGAGHLVATLACLATGWTGGREGPMLHAGATVGSAVAAALSRIPLPQPPRLRQHLVAAGAAGGVAGALNTPIGASLLVWALLLRTGRGRGFDVVGGLAVVGGAAAGALVHDLVAVPGPLLPTSVAEVSLGTVGIVVSAAVPAGLAYLAALHHAPRLLARLARTILMPLPVLGGLLVAAAVLVVPQTGGTGTVVLDGSALAPAGLPLVIGMLVAATLMPAVTVAARGCGGTIGPALVLGCVVGEVVARTAGALHATGMVGQPEVCRLVGMATVLAAALRLPLAAAATVVELTGAYAVAGPLLVGAVIASILAGAGSTATLFRKRVEPGRPVRAPDHERTTHHPNSSGGIVVGTSTRRQK